MVIRGETSQLPLPPDDWFTCTECVNQRPRIGGDCLESESFRALLVSYLNGDEAPMIDRTTAALRRFFVASVAK